MKSFEPTSASAANKNARPTEPQEERQFSRETAVKALKTAREVVQKSDATEKELELAMTELHSHLVFSLQKGNCTELIGIDKKEVKNTVIRNGREFAKQNGVTYDEKFDPFVFVPIEEYEHARIGKPGEVFVTASAHYNASSGEIVVSSLAYEERQLCYPLPTFEYPATMFHEVRHRTSWQNYIIPYLRTNSPEEPSAVSELQRQKNTMQQDIVVDNNFYLTHRMIPELLMWVDEILAYTVTVQVSGSLDFATQIEDMKDPKKYFMKYAPPDEIEERIVVLLASALEMGISADQIMKTLINDVFVKEDIRSYGWTWVTDNRMLLSNFASEIINLGVEASVLDPNDLSNVDETMAGLAKKYYIKAQIKADIAMASALFALADVYDRSELVKAEMVSMTVSENVKDTNYYLRLTDEPTNLGFNEYPPHLILQVREPFTYPNGEAVPVEYELSLVGRNRLTGWNDFPRPASSYGYSEKDAPMLAEKLYRALNQSEKQNLVNRCKDSHSFFVSSGDVVEYRIGDEFLRLLEEDGYISTEDKDRFSKIRSSEHRIHRNDDAWESLRESVNMLADPAYRQRKENTEEAKTLTVRYFNKEALAIGILGRNFSKTNSGADGLVRIFIPDPAVVEESKRIEGVKKIGNVRLELAQLTKDNVPEMRIPPMEIASRNVASRVMQVLSDEEKEDIAAAVREDRIDTESELVLNELKRMLAQEGYILEANATLKTKVKGAIRRRISWILSQIN